MGNVLLSGASGGGGDVLQILAHAGAGGSYSTAGTITVTIDCTGLNPN